MQMLPCRSLLVGLLAIVCCASSAYALRRGNAAASRAAAFASAVRKPLTDHRRYEHTVLEENGLKVLAVEDPKAVKAGFAVAVQAGSFYDPPELPGLAHFCEHLLFLGTKKYPDEASFDTFMSEHDGSNNAFTEQERTVFFNEVAHDGFEEGMDRFAQFFIAPLFKQDMVGRELNAVNSEHEKNKPDQNRRLWEVLRGTARKDSVMSRFYTGTVESLHHGDAGVVAALRKYHDANYCGTRMSLVMVSNRSTAVQLKSAREHFAAVPRGKCEAPTDFGGRGMPAPFDHQHTGQLIRMGTDSTPTLWMMFPLSPTVSFYKESPTQYLDYVLGYAGPHSLRSRLKRGGWITDLNLQVDESSAGTLVFIMYELTPKGVEEFDQISGSTLAFLRLLKEEHDGEVPAVYESIQQMSRVSFDYVEAPDSVMDAVSDLASSMAQYPPEDVLTGSNGQIDRTSPGLVRGLLKALADPRNMNLALATPGFNASSATRFEKYYDIHFAQERIPEAWMERWAAEVPAKEGLAAPPPMRYAPTALAVINASAGATPVPLQVFSETSGDKGAPLELWWKGRGEFALPKAQLRLKLSLPKEREADAQQEAFRRLHAELVGLVLEEATDDLKNCGMEFNVLAAGDGYHFSLDGYDQHLDQLLVQVLQGFMDPQFEPADFANAHRKVVNELSDVTRSMPYELALDALSALTTDDVTAREEVLAALQNLDERTLRDHLAAFRQGGVRAQLLVAGNVDKEAATHMAAKAAKALEGGGRGLIRKEDAQKTHVRVAPEGVEVRIKNPIPEDRNHATINSYQYGVPDIAERVNLLLLGKMISNPVYDTLRTKKQLGYVVFGFMTEQVSVLELKVLVQGEKELPDAVDDDIEGVLAEFGAHLKNMSAPEFSRWKASLRSSLHHKDQNMGQEADRYWSQIANDGHCFNRKELELAYLETLESPHEVLRSFETIWQKMRKVSMKMFGAGADAAAVNKTAPSRSSVLVLDGVGAAQKKRLLQTGATAYSAEGICRVAPTKA
jgi:insulysin